MASGLESCANWTFYSLHIFICPLLWETRASPWGLRWWQIPFWSMSLNIFNVYANLSDKLHNSVIISKRTIWMSSEGLYLDVGVLSQRLVYIDLQRYNIVLWVNKMVFQTSAEATIAHPASVSTRKICVMKSVVGWNCCCVPCNAIP